MADPVFGAPYLRDVYAGVKPDYTGRVTVPVLLDTETRQIVSNESAEIIRMFNTAFDGSGAAPGDYYPAALRDMIDTINARVYDTLNNGVYKSGFAQSQEAYEDAVLPVFDTLDWMEDILGRQHWLAGDRFTEADFRAAKFTNQVHHFMEVARWERFTTSSIWTSVLNWIACEMQAIHFDELER